MMLLPRGFLSLRTTWYGVCMTLCVIALYHFLTAGGIFVPFVRPKADVPQTTTPENSQSSELQGFPKILWYKLGPNGLNHDTRRWTDTCIKSNPGYRAEFMTEESGDEFVKKTFAWRPDIVENYLSLTIPILKADWLRYMLLFDQGGIWSDLDIECLTPIDEWVPQEHVKNASVVVGWEFDIGWTGKFVRQFASWTIMAKPHSPHMMQVIEDIQDALHEKMDEYKVPVDKITLDMTGDVVDFSGPRRLTFGIYKSLGKALNRTVTEQEMAELIQPKLLGDVLVMPGRSFANSSNKYSAKQEMELPPALVTHHYAGSWKNAKGGEGG